MHPDNSASSPSPPLFTVAPPFALEFERLIWRFHGAEMAGACRRNERLIASVTCAWTRRARGRGRMYRRLKLGGERFREKLTEHARGMLRRDRRD